MCAKTGLLAGFGNSELKWKMSNSGCALWTFPVNEDGVELLRVSLEVVGVAFLGRKADLLGCRGHEVSREPVDDAMQGGPVVLSGKGTRLGSSRTEAKACIPKSHQIWSIFATMSPV